MPATVSVSIWNSINAISGSWSVLTILYVFGEGKNSISCVSNSITIYFLDFVNLVDASNCVSISNCITAFAGIYSSTGFCIFGKTAGVCLYRPGESKLRTAPTLPIHHQLPIHYKSTSCLLAPTGALVVMMVYNTYIYKPTFSDFEHLCLSILLKGSL